MGYRSNQAIDLDEVEIEIDGLQWICNVKAQVEVETDCDYGDNGYTSWGSGPSCETHIEEMSATCWRFDDDGNEIATRTLEGKEAEEHIEEEPIIERAVEQHNQS